MWLFAYNKTADFKWRSCAVALFVYKWYVFNKPLHTTPWLLLAFEPIVYVIFAGIYYSYDVVAFKIDLYINSIIVLHQSK
jgi:hypothetical protein